jgi:hypothetical protein
MCREYKTTVQLLLMQVFLQLFLTVNLLNTILRAKKGVLNKKIPALDQFINNAHQKPKSGYLLSFVPTFLQYCAVL